MSETAISLTKEVTHFHETRSPNASASAGSMVCLTKPSLVNLH